MTAILGENGNCSHKEGYVKTAVWLMPAERHPLSPFVAMKLTGVAACDYGANTIRCRDDNETKPIDPR